MNLKAFELALEEADEKAILSALGLITAELIRRAIDREKVKP
jgi:hypothetical protein